MLSPVKAITAGALVFALGGAFVIAQPFGQQGSVPGAGIEDAEGTVTSGDNVTCEYGQGSTAVLPACDRNDDDTMVSITFMNPRVMSGPFDGISVLDGTLMAKSDDTFGASGTMFFAGEVEGCGSGTVIFEWSGQGTVGADGAPVWETSTLSAAPGGPLPVTATIDELGVNEATANGDGTRTLTYSVSYSCTEA